MRVIHKGYAATTYGKSSLSVSDSDGKVVYHTDCRNDEKCTEEDLKTLINQIRKGVKV